jgi:hypothetical protein
MPETLDNAYGWFGNWFRFLKPESFAAHIAEIVVENASRKFQIRQRELRTIPRATPHLVNALGDPRS